ncbi:MAG: arylsulfatase [Thermodesulfobacteriota bacterium]|nr:arylsulfatase [Thermodesulfobacteriota bacterium]
MKGNRNRLICITTIIAGSLVSTPALAADRSGSVLPIPPAPFEGKVGENYKESEEAWPKLPAPKEDAPNILVVLLDDVGFGQTSTFGGLIPTPNLDTLADQGLRYNRFHTTAICSPSRAALLTGRNHHDSGFGFLMEWATGYPSYNCMIPRSTATVAEVLKQNGYSTSWFGKNHNTPDWETSVAGPFDRWPSGLGFDYFYGFHAGETHQYYPVIFENTTAVEPDKSPEEGYHFMTDMTDKAIQWMRYNKSVAPNKPFFMYFAPGAMHAPHHVTKEWREQFTGKFDMGWDKAREQIIAQQKEMGIIPADTELTIRPDWVPAWDSLSAEQKKLYTRLIENFAGYFAFTDHEVGRLVDAVGELPDGDNTLIIYIVGDNGASSEGGPDGTVNEIKMLNGEKTTIEETLARFDEIGDPSTEPHYPVGWAWAGNTPFQWVKQVASHLGGTRNPMVVSWPSRIKPDGKMRDQFLHLIDIMPTILDVAGVSVPTSVNGVEQKPLDGVSFAATFTKADAAEVRPAQYFEVFSNRSMYADGWKANAQHTFPWRQDYAPGNWDKDKWELYHLDKDFSEAKDLAESNPEKLAELKALWLKAAEENNVFPLDDRGAGRLMSPKPPVPGATEGATHFTYYEGATRLAETAAPNMKNRSWSTEATLNIGDKGSEGVIFAIGGVSAGMSFYITDSKPVFHYNWFDEHRYVVKSDTSLPAGEVKLRLDFAYDGEGAGKGGTAAIFINDKQVAEGRIDKTVAGRFGIDTFGIGEDTGAPVTFDYKPPFAFTSSIEKVDIELK